LPLQQCRISKLCPKVTPTDTRIREGEEGAEDEKREAQREKREREEEGVMRGSEGDFSMGTFNFQAKVMPLSHC
jgi:hypothetical protein